MRILYLGLPLGALTLMARGHVPVVCAIGHPDAPGMRRLRARLPRTSLLLGRPPLEDPAIDAVLASSRYDVVLSWFWPRRVPVAVLERAPLGAFGTHPSLLPRWRGPDPYFHAIRSGDQKTGVTLHRLDASYDTGAIVASIEVAIDARDTGWSLARRLDRPALCLLAAWADALARGETFEGRPQGSIGVTDAPAPSEDDLVLQFRARPGTELLRLIRAAAPHPGATALLGEHEVAVIGAELYTGSFPSGLRPGEAFLEERGVIVRAAEAGLLLTGVRVEETGEIHRGAGIAELLRRREPHDG